MKAKKRILLKLTGEIFLDSTTKNLSMAHITDVISQLKQLIPTHQFGIVIGGGNFFRGSKQGKSLDLPPTIGHQIGMLATIMNGLMVKELLERFEIKASLLCAIPMPGIGLPTSQQDIASALNNDHTIVFAGGTGNPFFTTDTNAVLRGLQIEADEIWKGTTIDGIYTADPHTTPDAQLLKEVSYKKCLESNLAIMDATAFAMAEQHKQKIRIFDIFKEQALIHAALDKHFGSIIL